MLKNHTFWMGVGAGILLWIVINYFNPGGIACTVNNLTGKATGNG